MTELKKVSEETMRFMRGTYALDEVGDGKDELKFRRGGKTILTVYKREDRFDFLVIFGKVEREKFEAERDSYPQSIRDIYDNSRTYHDGKWMFIPVADSETLEAVKRLIIIKKKPNRKPFSKETTIYGKCGHRCDLCVHYVGIDSELRQKLRESCERVYGGNFYDDGCPGCREKTEVEGNICEQLKCAADKGCGICLDCKEYPCGIAPVTRSEIHSRAGTISAEDITYAVLPFVHEQYGSILSFLCVFWPTIPFTITTIPAFSSFLLITLKDSEASVQKLYQFFSNPKISRIFSAIILEFLLFSIEPT